MSEDDEVTARQSKIGRHKRACQCGIEALQVLKGCSRPFSIWGGVGSISHNGSLLNRCGVVLLARCDEEEGFSLLFIDL